MKCISGTWILALVGMHDHGEGSVHLFDVLVGSLYAQVEYVKGIEEGFGGQSFQLIGRFEGTLQDGIVGIDESLIEGC